MLSSNGLYDQNLFVYCDNNPVIREDSSGEFWNIVVGGAVGFLSVAVSDIVSNIQQGKTGLQIFERQSSWGDYLGATLSGMIPGMGLSRSVARFAVGLGSKYAAKIILSEKINVEEIFDDVASNVVAEIGSFGISKAIDDLMPRNYSSFKYKVNQYAPQLSRQETVKLMQKVSKGLRVAGGAAQFTLTMLSAY